MNAAAQSAPDSMMFSASGSVLALLYELKTTLQQARPALLRSNLEEIYANTARLKAVLRGLDETTKKSGLNISPQKASKIALHSEIEKLKSEIQQQNLLYAYLIHRKQRTASLLSRMLPNSAVTYSPEHLGR